LFIYKVNFNLLHNLASNLLQDKPGWFSGKSCAVTIPRTIPYVEINSTTKFALECNEGLIMTLNSNMQASVTALWYKMCTMYLGFLDKHGFTYLWIYFFLHIVNTFSVTL
jgi:hypothetical protein